LPAFKRAGKVPAVVEYVVSASRFRVYIPRESAKATLVLAGIRAPKSARIPADKSEPFGQEALEYANKKVLQRDVEIEVEAIDKTGGFIGTLWLKPNENFAVSLLREGYAEVHDYSAERSPYTSQLYEAEKIAKEAKKNIWSIERNEPAVQAAEEKKPNEELVELVVTEVIDGGRFFCQFLGARMCNSSHVFNCR
jgi:staphylococcal nuclease domain-containing protein 1